MTSTTEKKARTKRTAESMASEHRSISISEFFTKNAHLLGFDNPRKALLTTVKEAVDNSLDACEEAGILPDIEVSLLAVDGRDDRFIVTVTDNGPGIPQKNLPRVFGKLLYGSKFHRLRMSRGQQGIGISAAGMYGMLTTGKALRVISRPGEKADAFETELTIDTKTNEPVVIKEKKVDWRPGSGIEVAIELKGKYLKGRQSVDEYMEQTAVANPHAEFTYIMPDKSVRHFPRGVEKLPPEAKEIKPHPYGVELGMLIKMLKDTKESTLSSFLCEEFSRVGPGVAKQICDAAKLSTRARPSSTAHKEAESLWNAIQATKIIAPPTDCLSPIGVEQILKGMHKELGAEFYTAVTRKPTVYRGNPFAIEVGLAFGGQLPMDELARVMRFANRVPLLYQSGACAISKAVQDVSWKNYGVSQSKGAPPTGPLVILVHMASVWVPFTNESKEAIADYDIIRDEIDLAVKDCARKLGLYTRRRARALNEARRRDVFENYIDEVCRAVESITGKKTEELKKQLKAMAKEKTELANLLDQESAEGDAEKLEKDTSTIIVEENIPAAPETEGNLLGEDNPPKKKSRKPKDEE
ncbi:MAG: DNA topoisomerase VI subunit B [Planctomycetota bacterium]